MLFDTQRHNPITGDTQLSPASFGLSMKDVDAAWSLNLKSALNSWGLSLTADHYRELQQIQEKKYWALDATSWILSWPLIPAVNMTGKAPWLYATQSHLWFWNGDKWVSYIGNNGAFQFKGNDDNYIQWNPLTSTLEIKGALQMWDANLSAEEYIDNLKTEIDKEIEKVDKKIDSKIFDFNLHDAEKQSDGKYKLFLNSQNLRSFTLPPRYSGVYMSRDWLYAYNNGNATFELNANTGDALFRGKVYASGGEFTGSITSRATITWWRVEGASISGSIIESISTARSWEKIIIRDGSISVYKQWQNYAGVSLFGWGIVFSDGAWAIAPLIYNKTDGWWIDLTLDASLYLLRLRVNGEQIYLNASKSNTWTPLTQWLSWKYASSTEIANLKSSIEQLERRINSMNSGPSNYVEYIDSPKNGMLTFTDNRWNWYYIVGTRWWRN